MVGVSCIDLFYVSNRSKGGSCLGTCEAMSAHCFDLDFLYRKNYWNIIKSILACRL